MLSLNALAKQAFLEWWACTHIVAGYTNNILEYPFSVEFCIHLIQLFVALNIIYVAQNFGSWKLWWINGFQPVRQSLTHQQFLS